MLQSFLVAGVASASYAALVVKLEGRYHQSLATATATGPMFAIWFSRWVQSFELWTVLLVWAAYTVLWMLACLVAIRVFGVRL